MIGAQTYRDLVSGHRRGVAARTVRAALSAAELPYTWAVLWRNRRYDRSQAAIHRAEKPVLSVGNLTLGGTGKTPIVRWIARQLMAGGEQIAILSRGYGSPPGKPNDEALELALALPGVPHLQNPDRVASARIAVEENDAQVLLLDDGFQHRRLARDLDIVLLDALEPFGYGRVFPRGFLREPVRGLGRADVVVLSRADLIDREARTAIHRSVSRLAPEAAWCEVAHVPRSFLSASGERHPIGTLSGRRVAAFCGIGNPAGFRRTIESCHVDIVALKEYADHHDYASEEATALAEWVSELDVSAVLCTVKDQVKLPLERIGRLPLLAVEIEIEFLAGENVMLEAIWSATRKGAKKANRRKANRTV